MATLELDPGFMRALRLFHSRSKDSASQLRIMVDDAIAGKKAPKLKLDSESEMMFEPKRSKHNTPSPSRDDRKEKDREKERLQRKEKEKREQDKERERQEQREKHRESERERERSQQEDMESDESTEEYDRSMNADDFAFDLGVCCQVCNKFDITPKNRLVECQECHALYHQECHKPAVVGNITDPRFVWYCNKCSKTMKKMHAIQSQKQSKTKTAPTPAPSKESSSSSSSSKPPDPLTLAQPFQRTEKKIPSKDSQSSSSGSSSQPFKGLAGLAANLTKGSSKAESKALLTGWKTEPVKPGHKDSSSDKSSRLDSKSSKESKGEKSGSSTTSSSSSSGTFGSKSGSSGGGGGSGNGNKQPSMSGNTMASANKRLQLMKKSAAAKQQEKRVHIK